MKFRDWRTYCAVLDERQRAASNAVERARVSMERRLDGMNEFREALKDTNAQKIDRKEVEALAQSIMSRIDRYEGDARLQFKGLDSSRNQATGRLAAYGTVFVVLNAVITVAILLLKKP